MMKARFCHLFFFIFSAFFYFVFPIGWNLISTGILQLISWGHKHTHIRLFPGSDYMHESNQKTFVLKCSKIPYIALRFDNIPKRKENEKKNPFHEKLMYSLYIFIYFFCSLVPPTSHVFVIFSRDLCSVC